MKPENVCRCGHTLSRHTDTGEMCQVPSCLCSGFRSVIADSVSDEELIKHFAWAVSRDDIEAYTMRLEGGRHRLQLDDLSIRRRRNETALVVAKFTVLSSRTLIPDGKAFVLFTENDPVHNALRFFRALLGSSERAAIESELTAPKHLGAKLWVHVRERDVAPRVGSSVTLLDLHWARARSRKVG